MDLLLHSIFLLFWVDKALYNNFVPFRQPHSYSHTNCTLPSQPARQELSYWTSTGILDRGRMSQLRWVNTCLRCFWVSGCSVLSTGVSVSLCNNNWGQLTWVRLLINCSSEIRQGQFSRAQSVKWETAVTPSGISLDKLWSSSITFSLWNCQSSTKKMEFISSLKELWNIQTDTETDYYTETWICPENTTT